MEDALTRAASKIGTDEVLTTEEGKALRKFFDNLEPPEYLKHIKKVPEKIVFPSDWPYAKTPFVECSNQEEVDSIVRKYRQT